MIEYPIIFSAEMVKAILAGTKTQTRRVIKRQPQPSAPHYGIEALHRAGDIAWPTVSPHYPIISNRFQGAEPHPDYVEYATATYKPGNRLWVRENFIGAKGYDELPPSKFGNKPSWYCADGEPDRAKWWHLGTKVRPAIHMPRWISRINLEVIGAKVERLQAITEADAKAEGCCVAGEGFPICTSRKWFEVVWDGINGEGAWAANPWVVAILFRRLP